MLTLYDQTMFSDPEEGTHGDCARACVATLLQIPPSSLPVPINQETGEWNTKFHAALRDLGYSMRSVDYHVDYAPDAVIVDLSWGGFKVPRVVMAGGRTARGAHLHAVIYDRLAERVLHDPHPSRAGLTEILSFDYLGPYPKPTEEH